MITKLIVKLIILTVYLMLITTCGIILYSYIYDGDLKHIWSHLDDIAYWLIRKIYKK